VWPWSPCERDAQARARAWQPWAWCRRAGVGERAGRCCAALVTRREHEVLARNAPARLLYEEYGFVAHRRLVGFTLAGAPLRSRPAGRVRLHPIGTSEALALFAACAAEELAAAAPPWQLEAPSLVRLGPSTRMYAVVPAGAEGAAGYLVLGPEGPLAGLVHLGILPAGRRRGLGTAALVAALAAHPEVEGLSVPPLVPDASPLVPFLQAVGAVRDADEQLEMELDLR
jgi:GNAT superfamily N-acetyltransferase